jgi:hypothetical protein
MRTEVYNERVVFQILLDEMFPEGAYVVVTRERPEIPSRPALTGVELITGRLFVADAVPRGDDDWAYQLLIDPRVPGDTGIASIHPYSPWIASVLEQDESLEWLFHAEIIAPGADPERVGEILTVTDGAGPARMPVAGAREIVTAKWEPVLFPRGVKEISLGVVQ